MCIGFLKKDRLKHSVRLLFIRTSVKRMAYLRNRNVFGTIGNWGAYQGRVVPLYPKLIKLGSNVRISSQVAFVTHDTIHFMLNRKLGEKRFRENVGCIEVGDNVWIGTGSRILYDVRIGSNVIIGAGTLVNKDIPDNSVVAGVPAKRICSLDDFISKRETVGNIPEGMNVGYEKISQELLEWCWDRFYSRRGIEPAE